MGGCFTGEEIDMDTKDTLQRLMNPKTLEDFGLSVNLSDVLRECPDIFCQEIAPFLPQDVIDDLLTIQEQSDE